MRRERLVSLSCLPHTKSGICGRRQGQPRCRPAKLSSGQTRSPSCAAAKVRGFTHDRGHGRTDAHGADRSRQATGGLRVPCTTGYSRAGRCGTTARCFCGLAAQFRALRLGGVERRMRRQDHVGAASRADRESARPAARQAPRRQTLLESRHQRPTSTTTPPRCVDEAGARFHQVQSIRRSPCRASLVVEGAWIEITSASRNNNSMDARSVGLKSPSSLIWDRTHAMTRSNMVWAK